jgi:hypothetical protein
MSRRKATGDYQWKVAFWAEIQNPRLQEEEINEGLSKKYMAG